MTSHRTPKHSNPNGVFDSSQRDGRAKTAAQTAHFEEEVFFHVES
ncbi:MAG TPA: hypothetical protein PKA41_03140 [Verrucomicrobiota bacterium]|nr:hypothetical protein [Verrucomicrobiota bacterium]